MQMCKVLKNRPRGHLATHLHMGLVRQPSSVSTLAREDTTKLQHNIFVDSVLPRTHKVGGYVSSKREKDSGGSVFSTTRYTLARR